MPTDPVNVFIYAVGTIVLTMAIGLAMLSWISRAITQFFAAREQEKKWREFRHRKEFSWVLDNARSIIEDHLSEEEEQT